MTLVHWDLKWRSGVLRYKTRKDNQLCEIEIREVDNEKKRIKIHYKGFREDTDEWRDYGSLFDLEGFHTVVNFELIFRSGFPSIQQLCQWKKE